MATVDQYPLNRFSEASYQQTLRDMQMEQMQMEAARQQHQVDAMRYGLAGLQNQGMAGRAVKTKDPIEEQLTREREMMMRGISPVEAARLKIEMINTPKKPKTFMTELRLEVNDWLKGALA